MERRRRKKITKTKKRSDSGLLATSSTRYEARSARYLTQDGCCEAGDDAASEVDGELVAGLERRARLVCHVAERQLVTEFVDRELADGVWYLSSHHE